METNYDAQIQCSAEELFRRMEHKVNPHDLERLRRAFEFAREAHSPQRRKSGEPYIIHPDAVAQYDAFVKRGYTMPTDLEAPDFICDKFVIWYQNEEQLQAFRKISDIHFSCIDRGGTFREFVPLGYSKATGIQFVLDHYNLTKENAYAFGDSNNDLPMLSYLPNSVAMGNANPASLFDQVSFVTKKASEDGIAFALEHFSFL